MTRSKWCYLVSLYSLTIQFCINVSVFFSLLQQLGSGSNPFQHLEKSAVLQEARIFNETPINPRRCLHILTKIIYLLNQVRNKPITCKPIVLHVYPLILTEYVFMFCLGGALWNYGGDRGLLRNDQALPVQWCENKLLLWVSLNYCWSYK